MKTLFIINDPPYGTERLYNGLRLAHAWMLEVLPTMKCSKVLNAAR